MRVHFILMVCLMAGIGLAQTEDGKVSANVTTVPIDDGVVTVLHLGAGYTTSVRLPEQISSIVIGNPATFKAEHSQAEPRLVFLKPITTQPSESNALITTKSGQEISLHLVSAGKTGTNTHVDFLVEYRRSQSLLISSDGQSSVIAETRPASAAAPSDSSPVHSEKEDFVAKELESQKDLSSPTWEGKELLVAIGDPIERDQQTILGFSVLNSSKRTIELLPPQIELSGTAGGHGSKRIKAEPVAISEYHITTRRLAPGERADGVVVFERPTFKESAEQLQLQLAQADQVDHPILLPIPFTASSQGGER